MLCCVFFCCSAVCMGQQRWNIELKNDSQSSLIRTTPPTPILSMTSVAKPQLVRSATGAIVLLVYPVEGGQITLDPKRVIRITSLSDPLEPPTIEILPGPDTCCRQCEGCCQYNGFFIFDKLELRAIVGYRGRDSNSALSSATNEGSSFMVGLEVAGLWSLDDRGAFQLGPMIGIWPVDGSIFFPISIHPRYTFLPEVGADSGGSRWFIYGDVGIPIDFQTEAPVPGSTFKRQRLFYGVGIGIDCIWNCLSIDLGIRQMHLPLPLPSDPNLICQNCPPDQRNIYRLSTLLYLRLGITL